MRRNSYGTKSKRRICSRYLLSSYEDRTEIKYVTSVHTEPKVAKWDDGKEAMTFSKDYAKDLAFGLCVNGYIAIVMIKPDYLTLVNPESEDSDV